MTHRRIFIGEIPLISGMVRDPVASGVETTRARPGGNLTG